MERHFKVRAKVDFVYNEMGHNIEVKAGTVFEAKDIIVTVNKIDKVHLGIWIKPEVFLSAGKFKKNFEEI